MSTETQEYWVVGPCGSFQIPGVSEEDAIQTYIDLAKLEGRSVDPAQVNANPMVAA